MGTHSAYFDGARSRRGGRNHRVNIGYVILDPNGVVIDECSKISGDNHNHEERALLAVLLRLEQIGIAEVQVFGDCKSLIENLNSNRQCEALVGKCKKILDCHLGWTIEWIPREQNQYADALARCLPKKAMEEILQTLKSRVLE
jgi:ribonuclease HI